MNPIDINTLKGRLDLVKVVGHYLSLEKKGSAYTGLCPFHADRHPSLRVDPVKGLYHCFSCGAGGDALRFVQVKEGCGFMDAVRICAGICNLYIPVPDAVLPQHKPDKKPEAKAEKKIQNTPVPTVEENEHYRLALLPYDPGMDELREVYVAFEVGVAPAVVPKAYQFTRGRIVFPIHTAEGVLVAFAARYRGNISSKKILKYLNSSTSTLYKKDELLYGWHRAVVLIRETGIVFVTEGYKDTLAMHAAGFTNTVALCGTNLSVHHIALIRKEALTVYLLLDMDEAGRGTVATVLPILRKAGLRVIDVVPEGGKDPDEMFRAMGREGFARWIRRCMIPPVRRKAEALLFSACQYWPDTACLTPEGVEMPYIDSIMEVLEYEDLLPEDVANCTLLPPEELALHYELHTESSHSEPVRRSELICYLFLHYLEVCLAERIRQNSRRLSATVDNEVRYNDLLSILQYQRNYLCKVSGELGRRG